ncbi:hypothetical protein ES703_108074 [subsurface metagenome]
MIATTLSLTSGRTRLGPTMAWVMICRYSSGSSLPGLLRMRGSTAILPTSWSKAPQRRSSVWSADRPSCRPSLRAILVTPRECPAVYWSLASSVLTRVSMALRKSLRISPACFLNLRPRFFWYSINWSSRRLFSRDLPTLSRTSSRRNGLQM